MHVYFCMLVFEDVHHVAFNSLLPFTFLCFFFFLMENQHKQTREEWLAHLMLEVSLQGEVPLPTQHTIKNGEALHGSTGLPTYSCLQHQWLINDAKRCLKQRCLDWRAIDLKTQEIPCKSKIENRFFPCSSSMNIQCEKIPFICLPGFQLVILEELSVLPFPHGYINPCMVSTRQKGNIFTFKAGFPSLLVILQLRNYAGKGKPRSPSLQQSPAVIAPGGDSSQPWNFYG